MRAEVISIGDELTSGQRLDTNSQWLSLALGELGIAVVCHATVADDLAANVEVFRQAVERADVVIATGGLGPTADDLTREALAQASHTELVLDEQALAHIRSLFARRKREMPERNVAQAMFPAGSRVIHNPEGTAPGIWIEIAKSHGGTCHVFALPGVPAEMRQMWQGSVVAALVSLGAGQQVIRHRRIKCFGVGESDLEQMLPDLIRRGRTPTVGITVSDATITLRVTAQAADEASCFAQMEPTIKTIHECLGTLVFGEEDDELPDAVVRLLDGRQQTLATCEWGTRGLVADWLGEAAKNPQPYLGGVVAPSPEAVSHALGLPGGWLAGHSPNSAAAAEAMAAACRQRFASDFALAVGAFPAADPTSSAPGEVFFALTSARGTKVRSATFAGHSAILRSRAAKQALNLLRLAIVNRE
jgi:nicotinamide-nucleotide amidase